MKKVLLAFLCLVVLTSCGSNGEKKEYDDNSQKPSSMVDANTSNPDYEKGLDLVAKYQCITCHKVDVKLTGPAYREVANKYANAGEDQIAELAKKIINGGSGVWGEIPMTPHPNVSEEDAKTMIRYILLLKNNN